MKKIFIIDDDEIMAECLARSLKKYETKIFHNAIDAMGEISDNELPDLIFLDILLDGPDGFTFLNELISYPDTAKIPVAIVTSLDISESLKNYNVQKIFNKSQMTPKEIKSYADQLLAE